MAEDDNEVLDALERESKEFDKVLAILSELEKIILPSCAETGLVRMRK